MGKNNYDDIIHMPHHVSRKYPRMSEIDRAAQFSPFAALTGHDAAIRETARLTDQQIELDESRKAIINEKIVALMEKGRGAETSITYFVPDERKTGGQYITVSGKVKKVDEYDRSISLEDGIVIPIDDIYDI